MTIDKTLIFFDPQTASQREFELYTEFNKHWSQEMFPEDPPKGLEATKKDLQGEKYFSDEKTERYYIAHNGKMIAKVNTEVAYREDNQHILGTYIYVIPEYRRQGLAKQLLSKVLESAKKEKRTLIMSGSSGRCSAGQAFAERCGAELGSENHTNQLVLAEVDKALLQVWQKQGNSDDFELGFWTNPLPEDEIEAIAELMMVMNTAPRDDLEIEDWTVKPEDIREWEAYGADVGDEVWYYYVRHKASRVVAGYTEIIWTPENPGLVWQGATGVVPKYRGNRLGKWMKAVMIEHIFKHRPEATVIRTGNADSNAPMLKINHELGFKPYQAVYDWQLKVDKLEAYLKDAK